MSFFNRKDLFFRCKIEFGFHGISTYGVLIQQAMLKIQQIFHVEYWPRDRRSLYYDPYDV